MRRLIVIPVFLLLAGSGRAAAQIARCQLAPRPYGLGGYCRLERPEVGSSQPLRLPFADSVIIWITSGPQDRPPWRGNISLPGVETAFEIAPQEVAPNAVPLIFRTGLAWLPVKEWRQLDTGPEGCSACDRSAKQVLLILDLVKAPPATKDDIAILHHALAGLDKLAQWNRAEVQNCTTSSRTDTGLFCLLYTSVEVQMGRYHHRQPALELVRSVILERWRERITSHQLIDFNNHPATTISDLRTALQLALERARAEAQSGKE